MSDCLHCDINELVTKYAERPDSDASELAARMAESLVDLILMAPDPDRADALGRRDCRARAIVPGEERGG